MDHLCVVMGRSLPRFLVLLFLGFGHVRILQHLQDLLPDRFMHRHIGNDAGAAVIDHAGIYSAACAMDANGARWPIIARALPDRIMSRSSSVRLVSASALFVQSQPKAVPSVA